VPHPSPDGKNFVFLAFDTSGQPSLWIRPVNSQMARQLPGTENAQQVFWSADGKWIGFYAEEKLKKISPSGGNPQTLAMASRITNPPAWNGRGDIITAAGNRTPLYWIRESGGAPQQLTHLDLSRAENSHRYPAFLADGRRFRFIARSSQRENNALYIGSLDSGETRRLMPVQSNVTYLPPREGQSGTLLFVQDGTLMARVFDGEKVTGDPTAIVENVEYNGPSVYGAFAVSSNREVLIFRPATPGPRQFRWFDRRGNALGFLGPPGDFLQPRISPDEARVLFSRPDEQTGNRDIWSMEISRGVAARLTTNPANDWFPVWAPDGRSILFASDRAGGAANISFLKSSLEPGGGEAPLFDSHGSEAVPQDWSEDGKWIALGSMASSDIWILPTSGARTAFAFLATPFREAGARFSPDSKWIAYTSNESGRFEVYVRPFSGGPPTPTGKIQISSHGGDYPVWQRDGQELFFIGGDLKLYSVKTSEFGRGVPPEAVALFSPCRDTALAGLPMRGTSWEYGYDVSPDGQRFLINCRTLGPGRFDVMLNWADVSK
jgi:Tol biopolymer transport system component